MHSKVRRDCSIIWKYYISTSQLSSLLRTHFAFLFTFSFFLFFYLCTPICSLVLGCVRIVEITEFRLRGDVRVSVSVSVWVGVVCANWTLPAQRSHGGKVGPICLLLRSSRGNGLCRERWQIDHDGLNGRGCQLGGLLLQNSQVFCFRLYKISMPMPELLARASCRKDWKMISAELSLVSPRQHNRSRDWTELNWIFVGSLLSRSRSAPFNMRLLSLLQSQTCFHWLLRSLDYPFALSSYVFT